MKKNAFIAALLLACSTAQATDLEVTHWWTSGGEAVAVKKLSEAFNTKTQHKWVDGAIAGSGNTATPIIMSRILGGDPMGATQLKHGRDAEELIKAGLLLDLTDIAEDQGWKKVINPPQILDTCTINGRIYCAPLNIHSAQWIWLSRKAFEDAGVKVPTNWDEFVAAAPALEKAGKIPLAMGQQSWQSTLAFNAMSLAIAGLDAWKAVNLEKKADVARGPEYKKVFEAAAAARELSKNSKVQDWNQATNMVINGQAGGQIMGDWAQGEFQIAGKVAGKDYECLPGLGVHEVLDTGGDGIYFPVNKNADVTAAQKELARLLLTPELQVAFNLAKGSLPVRGDVDLASANDCMKKGLAILAKGGAITSSNLSFSPDTIGQIEDLIVEFWADSKYSAADAQKAYAAIIEKAD